jgi:hypothetical protein
MDINDTLFMYLNAAKIAKKHRKSKVGIRLEGFMIELNYMASKLLERHDTTCCCKQNDKHFEYQCMFHEEFVMASYHRGDYAHLGMEQVEQFVTFMASYELQPSFMKIMKLFL